MILEHAFSVLITICHGGGETGLTVCIYSWSLRRATQMLKRSIEELETKEKDLQGGTANAGPE